MGRRKTTNIHLPQYVTVIHGSYWYRPPSGENIRIGPEGQEHLVWKFMLDRAKPDAKPLFTIKDCIERYRREVLPTLAVRTQRDYARHLGTIEQMFGAMAPDDLKPRDIGRFLDRPKGKIHANRCIAVLSAMYSKMVGRWYVAEGNPCRDVERNPAKRRTRYVTDQEFVALYTLAHPRIRLAMDLALVTGQRQGDILALLQSAITPDGVLFQQSKTGKRLMVSMSPALRDILDRAIKMAPQVHIGGAVIRTRRGLPYTGEGFRACWQRLMRRALKLGVVRERFTFHDLRAKAVSDSKSIQEAFERAGHTSMAMTRGTYDRGIRKVTPLK